MEQFFTLQRAKNYKMFYENTIVLAWQKNEKLVTKKPVLTLNKGGNFIYPMMLRAKFLSSLRGGKSVRGFRGRLSTESTCTVCKDASDWLRGV